MAMTSGNISFAQTQTQRVAQEVLPNATLRYPKPVTPVQLQTTDTTAFTAIAEADFHVESLVAVNVTGTADTVTVHVVPDGGSADTGNTVIFEKAVPANDFVRLFDRNNNLFIPPGASIVATCGVNNAVNLHGFGFDYLGAYA